MKKLLTILTLALALCMLCSLALADDTEFESLYDAKARIHDISGLDDSHELVVADSKDATCKEAGWVMFECKTHGDFVHVYTLKKLDHTWVKDEANSKDATCTQDGKLVCDCSVCGEHQELVLPAKGHVMSSEVDGENWGIILPGKEPTCKLWGLAYDYCVAEWHDETVDNFPSSGEKYDTDVQREIAPIPHDFSRRVYKNVPNCLDMTIEYESYCSMCGGYEYDTDCYWPDWDQTESIHTGTLAQYKKDNPGWALTHDDKGHTWDTPTLFGDAPTYTCEAWTQICSCSTCAEKKLIKHAESPKYNLTAAPDLEWLVDCYTQRNTWYCTKCHGKVEGHQHVEYESVIAHDYDAVYDEWIPATCVSEGLEVWVCKYIDDPSHEGDETARLEFVIPVQPHVYGDWAELSPLDIPHGHAGLYARTCIYCGKVQEYRSETMTLADLQASTDPDKLQWQYYEDGDVAATCEDWGMKLYFVGTDWDNRTDERWIATDAPLGHVWVETTAPATCTTDGMTSRVCSRCGAAEAKVLPAPGHVEVTEDEVPATCGEDGHTKKVYCSECGEVLVDSEVIPATGAHDWVHYDEVPATCTVDGTSEYVECSVCGAQMVKKVALPAPGHAWGEWEETKAADCHNDGEAERVCSVCGVKDTKVLPAAEAHDWSEWTVTAEATCTVDGAEERVCSICGDKEINPIPAAHKFGEAVVVTEPTCTTAGLKTETCEVCSYIQASAIPATGHTEKVEEGYAATCGAAGLTDKVYCEVCGTVLVEAEAIPATGAHDYKPVAGKAATCTEDGVTNSVVCSVCGEVLLEGTVLPALGHDFTEIAAVDPTCTTDGNTYGKNCSRCDAEDIEPEVIPALGHKWDEGVITVEPKVGTIGEKTFTCERCGETRTEEVLAPAYYEVDDVDYSKPLATGKVVLDPTTEPLTKAYARVTFFLENGECMIQIVDVVDGTFKAGAEGNFVHISVVIIDVDDAYDAIDAAAHACGNGGIALD